VTKEEATTGEDVVVDAHDDKGNDLIALSLDFFTTNLYISPLCELAINTTSKSKKVHAVGKAWSLSLISQIARFATTKSVIVAGIYSIAACAFAVTVCLTALVAYTTRSSARTVLTALDAVATAEEVTLDMIE
jgi:hypothetical protein